MERSLRPTVGALLRDWRQRRRLSQLDLANAAGVSARHLSFLETGRSRPSREMVLHLAEQLDVPLRERNNLLLAAGYAPVYRSTDLADEAMRPVREALEHVLRSHHPFPALAVDRRWNLAAANDAVGPLLAGVADDLLAPPVNVLRLALHPQGVAPRIRNMAEWSAHLLQRLRRQHVLTGDDELADLYNELRGYPGVAVDGAPVDAEGPGALAVPLRLDAGDGRVLSFISTVTTFGTAVDITLAELSVEAFLPADADTATALFASLPLPRT